MASILTDRLLKLGQKKDVVNHTSDGSHESEKFCKREKLGKLTPDWAENTAQYECCEKDWCFFDKEEKAAPTSMHGLGSDVAIF